MKMKRLFTLVLSLMMILSLSAPASAIDGENVYTKEEISSINEVNVAKYLRIADGWNDYLRYINFNGYDYTRKDGWSFSVSK